MTQQILYIIGNGFDLYHGLDTWYSSYGLYINEYYNEIYEMLNKYCHLPELDEENEESLKDPLWSNFEKSLAELDIDEVLNDYRDYAAEPSREDFSDSEWFAIENMVTEVRDLLTMKMLDSFKEFIKQVEYPDQIQSKILKLEENAIFLNFNYTNSLEYYYQIPKNKIFYIHNNVEDSERLILGHGMNPDQFEEKEDQMPDGLSDEQKAEWYDAKSDEFDLSMQRGKDALREYFKISYKSTNEIISKNASFFDSLKNIAKVVVLGHSLSKIDEAYLLKVRDSTNNNAKWMVTYYSDKEVERTKNRLKELGLKEDKFSLIKMNDLR